MFKRHINWHFHADVRIYIVIDANCQVDQEICLAKVNVSTALREQLANYR